MQPLALIVGNFLEGAPLERYVSGDLAGRLSARGWGVTITSRKHQRLARLADMLKTTWVRRREYTVALVDVFSGPAFFWAEAVCWTLRRLGKPYVLTLHGGNLPAFAHRWPARVRALLQSAAAVTAPSAYLYQQMRPFRDQLLLLPNPLPIENYPFRLRQGASPRLIWVRAFHELYNPALAVQVLARLAPDFPLSRLTMVGPNKGDGSFQRTRRLAHELAVADRVSMPGSVLKHDVPGWLNQGDIFLNTASVDNTPVSTLEAMACGLCVVSTRVGGIPYLLRENQTALLVAPEDPDAMAQAVRRLLREPELAGRLSGQGRRQVEAFDWAVIAPRWEKLLSAIAAGKHPDYA